jgi:hypothetical protein
VEAATSGQAASTASPEVPGNRTLRVLGSRPFGSPF